MSLFQKCLMVVAVLAFSVGTAASQQLDDRIYRLGVGDKLRVIVFGEEALSGEFEVGSQGTINLPLIDSIKAEGLTIEQLKAAVETSFAAGYLLAPKVSIEALNYRPFYILGEVNKPGSYPYVNGMTVLNAVALAGGFTYRADEGDILLSRSANDQPVNIGPDTPLLPGDIIRVEERFF